MKKRSTILAGCLALFMLVFSSCDKDDNPAPTNKTKTELLTQSSWKFEKATSGGIDVSAVIPSCSKDNIATFSSNLTGTIAEGAEICDPSSAGDFTWEFRTGETILYVSAALIPLGSNEFKLESLTETNLVVSQNVTIPPAPAAQNVVVTFKH